MSTSQKFSVNQKGLAQILIVLLIAAAIGGYLIYSGKIDLKQGEVRCTKEAKICPDGSSVGRIGPKCEFSPCPTSSDETADWKTYTNNKYGFELKHPSDWSVKIFNESYFVLGKKSDLEILKAEMLNHGWSEGMDIDIYKTEYSSAELQKEGVEKSPPNGEEDLNHYQYSKITLGEKPANETISLSKEEYFQFPYTSIIFNFKGRGWNIKFPNIDYKGNHDEVYNQILSTFKFTN